MSRSDGLKKRAVGSAAAPSTNNQFDNDRDDETRHEDGELEDHDSKETRLTLMEEVLLLGLKDREASNPIFQ